MATNRRVELNEKQQLARQWLVGCGETRVVGTASPGYSALQQDLFLEVEPERRGKQSTVALS